jgi:hypothetical protein
VSRVLFIVGAPGAGKTTLVRGLLGMDRADLPIGGYLIEKPKWTVTPALTAAGHYTNTTFDGADMVPYNGAAAALAYWQAHLAASSPLTIFDGDRFSNGGVLTTLRGHQLECVHLIAPASALEERRLARGSNQNASWMKGRASKAANFAKLFAPEARCEVDGGAEPSVLLERLRVIIRA